MAEIEQHPFSPFLPINARLLMLGSFPPQKRRWSMDFYYPNIQNDMWRIFGLIFFDNKNYFLTESKKSFDKERLSDFLNGKGVALFDTASAIKRLRDNASDKFLEVVEPTDIGSLLHQIPLCRAIVTTGQKATDTVCKQIQANEPSVGNYSEFLFKNQPFRFYRMPSSSRAYPLSLEKKTAIYRIMFEDLQLI